MDILQYIYLPLIPHPMEDKTLSHYKVIRLFARGPETELYNSLDLHSGKNVAIKITPSNKITSFHTESTILKSISHPSIVEFIDSFELKGCGVMVMRLINGYTLKRIIYERRLRRERLDISCIRAHMIGVVSALKYLHSKNIYHTNLLPNHLLIEDNKVFLCGFGCAKYTSDPYSKNLGGEIYLPESIRGESVYLPDVDVWALASLTYYACEFNLPFKGRSVRKTMRNIKSVSVDMSNLKSFAKEICGGVFKKKQCERIRMDDIEGILKK